MYRPRELFKLVENLGEKPASGRPWFGTNTAHDQQMTGDQYFI